MIEEKVKSFFSNPNSIYIYSNKGSLFQLWNWILGQRISVNNTMNIFPNVTKHFFKYLKKSDRNQVICQFKSNASPCSMNHTFQDEYPLIYLMSSITNEDGLNYTWFLTIQSIIYHLMMNIFFLKKKVAEWSWKTSIFITSFDEGSRKQRFEAFKFEWGKVRKSSRDSKKNQPDLSDSKEAWNC